MLAKRVLVVAALLPIGILAIYYGGWIFTSLVAVFLICAAWEYQAMFRAKGLRPARLILLTGVLLLLVDRNVNGFGNSAWILSLLVLVSLTYHLIDYERGADQSATEFGLTLAGILYIGWIGSYLISLRNLPWGYWWFLLVLPSVWLADAAAYFIGKGLGRHKLAPRLSPKKTWEGYLGGIFAGTLLTVGLAVLLQDWAGPGNPITPWRGLWIGLAMSILPTLGDLGESMFKRQLGFKDSSHLLPGHGGFFDRIDSWLWAGVLGYYLIIWLWA